MESEKAKDLEADILEYINQLDATIHSATHVNEVIRALQPLASKLFNVQNQSGYVVQDNATQPATYAACNPEGRAPMYSDLSIIISPFVFLITEPTLAMRGLPLDAPSKFYTIRSQFASVNHGKMLSLHPKPHVYEMATSLGCEDGKGVSLRHFKIAIGTSRDGEAFRGCLGYAQASLGHFEDVWMSAFSSYAPWECVP